jgi:hypothetical protein
MNQPLSFTPSNELEALQIVAAKEPAQRESFWKLLLSSDVWVVADSKSDTDVVLYTWGEGGDETCGVYTSQALIDKAMEPDTQWLQVNAAVIFQSMVDEGLGVFINPRYEQQVRLRASELSSLLTGGFSEVHGSDA